MSRAVVEIMLEREVPAEHDVVGFGVCTELLEDLDGERIQSGGRVGSISFTKTSGRHVEIGMTLVQHGANAAVAAYRCSYAVPRKALTGRRSGRR